MILAPLILLLFFGGPRSFYCCQCFAIDGSSFQWGKLLSLSSSSSTTTISCFRRKTVQIIPPADDDDDDDEKGGMFTRSTTVMSTLISRTVPISSDWNITVYEWENPADVVERYWKDYNQRHQQKLHQLLGQMRWEGSPKNRDYDENKNISLSSSSSSKTTLDPFGLVCWPGSVVAANLLREHADLLVRNRTVLVLGAGVGVEVQAVAELGSKSVIATDVHPTTLRQVEIGVNENPRIIKDSSAVQTQLLDLFDEETYPIPSEVNTIVASDVLYNDQLASQLIRRIVEATTTKQNPRRVRILVTDSQRFVDTFVNDLNVALSSSLSSSSFTYPKLEWNETRLIDFTGSGVCIDEDQTYDVTVRWMII